MKNIIILLILFVLVGCTAGKENIKKSHGVDRSGNYIVKYKLASKDAKYKDKLSSLHFMFLSVHGQLYGKPELPFVDHSKPTDHQRFNLSLPTEVKSTVFNQPGLAIVPNTTKVIRVGTFIKDDANPNYMGGGAFQNLETNNYLLLVHVDQKSSITGNHTIEGVEYSHAIQFPHAGWFWVEINKESESVKRYSGSEKDIAFISIDI